MKTLRLSAFGDTSLSSIDDARMFRARLGPEDRLDFAGITEVTEEFLDVLLDGMAPEEVAARALGLDAIDAAMARWVARRTPGRLTPVTAPQEPSDRYTPTRLVRNLRAQLTRYLEGAYPLNNPVLIKARRELLERSLDGRLLAQDPFVETTPRYRAATKRYDQLAVGAETASLLQSLAGTLAIPELDAERTLLFPSMYQHQAEAYETLLGAAPKNTLVATGTGSGKTETFLVPLAAMLHREASTRPASFARRGVRALILYPMNALVNDQLARLRLLFGSPAFAERFHALGGGEGRHPTFGMYTGRTLYPGPRMASKDADRVGPHLDYYLGLPDDLRAQLQRMGRYPAKDLTAFLAADKAHQGTYRSGKRAGKTYTAHEWEHRLLTADDDRELLTRHEMVHDAETGEGHAPDVLVTNYSMLEYMLMRPFERPLFEETRAWLAEPGSRFVLVLDEAHMYRGARGAEVAFLIRRLRARLGVTDRPDKFAAICTSASLGRGADARENARRFAADLTGLAPESFAVVTGEREVPTPYAPGSAVLAEMLAAIDLDALHAGAGVASLRDALAPLFEHLGGELPAVDGEATLLRALHDLLKGRDFLHELIRLTAGEARALEALASALFPGAPHARKATEVLLTLGTLARPRPDEPGLLPTRVHVMFRGLAGLYACLEPRCAGRQALPGAEAPVGKLFTEPRPHCDACGSRVYEIASCRECGAVYYLAWTVLDPSGAPDFLWNERSGDLTGLQLLAEEPRDPGNDPRVLELEVQRTTGAVLSGRQSLGAGETRRLWAAVDREQHTITDSFRSCPMCQPAGGRRQTRVLDFRTKGEQSFTALIEAQFAEQPPQKNDVTLPNRGRKVLVFSDGRQKAARLAPALETNHAADVFRQVLAMAARSLRALGDPGQMHRLYPAILDVCARRTITLFPNERRRAEFDQHVAVARGRDLRALLEESAQGHLPPPVPYADALFREVTDRFFSLSAIGLATIGPSPHLQMAQGFPAVGLTAAEVDVLLRHWLRMQIEARRFLLQSYSRYSIGEEWERPEAIRPAKLTDLVPERFQAWLLALLEDEQKVGAVLKWFEAMPTRLSTRFWKLDEGLYLTPSMLTLELRIGDEHPWLRCTSCNRLYAASLRGLCSECVGALEPVAADPTYLDARSGYYRNQVLRAIAGEGIEPFGLVAAEHSAQLTGIEDTEAFTKTERYELLFQDIPVGGGHPVDVLSCTTTMEVGIDIGTLCGVALRNVPPHVANYQQRAGRAGRRGRTIASVITFAQGGSHDAFYFDHPAEIISGAVRSPVVYVENQKVLSRHVNAFLVQRYFHEAVAADAKLFKLFESLGTVGSFFADDDAACTFDSMRDWLSAQRETLRAELRAWVPSFGHGLGAPIATAETIDQAVPRLIALIEREFPIEKICDPSSAPEAEREGIERLVEEQLLEAFIGRAIFPRYAFPTDTVAFWVRKPSQPGRTQRKVEFEYQPQRDLTIALTEYAPTRELTIDKKRFRSAGLYNPYGRGPAQMIALARSYLVCGHCGFVSLRDEHASLTRCLVCNDDRLRRLPFVRPEGFAPDINVEPPPDRGGSIDTAGQSSPAQLQVVARADWEETRFDGRLRLTSALEDLVVVNTGIDDRGFMICPQCGRAEPVYGRRYTTTQLVDKAGRSRTHDHPILRGVVCKGAAAGPFFLGQTFRTDVLLLRLKVEAPMVCASTAGPGAAARAALTSLVEALCLAASRSLQIDEGELAGNWSPVLHGGNDEADLFLYDVLPGGAGYTRDVRRNLPQVLDTAERLLHACTCTTSCHRCLRHYGNQVLHPLLDRHLAGALVRNLRRREVPCVAPEVHEACIDQIGELLRLRGVPFERNVALDGGGAAALIVRARNRACAVTLHHPLVDDPGRSTSVRPHGATEAIPVVAIDTWTVLHDLPTAFEHLVRGP
jgi:ATP-dependent helicase YprA (DUF1998 family)